jgi:putative restriction endonuclease
MTRPITFGEIEGITDGHWFSGRKEMMPSSFHRSWGAGIDGNGNVGTAAIVLSGGYEDDEDNGDEIIYTGAGGNAPNSGKQIENQSWENSGNAGLLTSMDQGIPVRVIRGHQHKSEFSPKTGYTYAGLYSVIDAWEELGKSGFKICRFRLGYCGENRTRRTPEDTELDYKKKKAQRKEGTVLRIVRDTKISRDLKELYKFECQICGIAIPTKKGLYAEGAHIKPLGKPHNGDDCTDNLLCLCPNHHVMFDKGSIAIDDSFNLLGQLSGVITVNAKHKIDVNNLEYHRVSHGYSNT